jgi:transcriptional regulator MraZ
MFRGNYPTRMDEKGRMKVPADFKHEIEERYGSSKFYITSRDGKVAEVYPMEEWETIEAKLDKLPMTNPALQKFLDATNYYGQVVEMDGQGRLLMPGLLREAANLQGEVAVVGNLRRLLVRNMEAYTKKVVENPVTDEDNKALSELGI